MSSSDDDWVGKTKPPGLAGAGSSDMDMMAARRQALRRQREAQQRQQQQQLLRSPSAGSSSIGGSQGTGERSSRRPPAAGRLGASSTSVPLVEEARESSLPAAFLGIDSSDNSSLENLPSTAGHDEAGAVRGGKAVRSAKVDASTAKPAATHRKQLPSSSSTSSAASSPPATQRDRAERVSEEEIEKLKRQVEAKKKVLQATREREAALREKWRAEKAQKQAEIHQLDAKLRTVWAAVEDEKSAAEAHIRTAQDEHEREMRQARQRIEQELKREYEPRIAALQEKLTTMREEEAQLRSLLTPKGETEDLVNAAVAAALKAIVGRIQKDFTAEQQQRDNEWHEHVRELVAHEVRTSFAVGVESEAHMERDAMRKNFSDALEFWREAEEEIKSRMLTMDDSLMADMETTVREDMGRLQREQLSMEEVYVQSREAWAVEHQRLLQAELDASLRRREAELEEYRKLRHQLHVEKVRDMEQSHEERVTAEERLHEAAMAQLRDYYGREEQLQGERQRVALAVQQDVARATETLKGVAGACESVLTSLKGYQSAVDDSRVALEAERRATLEQNEATLSSLQDLVAKQASSVEDELRTLTEALSKLRVLQEQVEQQLEAEAAWLGQQESAYEGNRAAWEREYRQWRALVQRERGAVEERFSTVLTALQTAIAQLNAEERDVNAESAAMERAYGDMTAAVQKELETLREKGAELSARQHTMEEAVAALESKREETTTQWREMQQERAELAQERAALQREEDKLEQTAETLHMLRRQLEQTKAQTVAASERGRLLQHQLALNMNMSNAVHPVNAAATAAAGGGGAAPPSASLSQQEQQHQLRRVLASSKHRLPQKIIAELKRQLHGVSKLSELPIDALHAPTRDVGVSPNVARLLSTPTASPAQTRQQQPPLPALQDEVSPACHRHADPAAAGARHAGETDRRQRHNTRHPSSPPSTEGGSGPVYSADVSPSPSPQQRQQRPGSDWSGVEGQSFMNLVGLSDGDSQF